MKDNQITYRFDNDVKEALDRLQQKLMSTQTGTINKVITSFEVVEETAKKYYQELQAVKEELMFYKRFYNACQDASAARKAIKERRERV